MTSAKDRLAKMRERKEKADGVYVEPTITKEGGDFTTQQWYKTVRSDPSAANINAAGDFYAEAIEDGKKHIVPVGNLETLQLQLPGLSYFYQTILVDVQQIRRWLEERLSRLEAQKHNYYMYDDEVKAKYGTLKTTDATKLAKGCDEVVDMANAVRLMAYHEHNMEALMDAFENLKYVLNNVVAIRKEHLEEVWVDPTTETSNA